jgi:hypothetical protein
MSVNDFESPVNGGLWTIAWPTIEFYESGLALMRNASWNSSHGFNGIGRPRALYRDYPWVRARLANTRMLRTNSWIFSMGDCDQAFFFYALYLQSHVGRDFEPVDGQQCNRKGCSNITLIGSMTHGKHFPESIHTARHWYSAPKPWVWTKCQASKAKYSTANSCDLLPKRRSDWLPTGGRTFWYLAHTDFAARVHTSRCAAAFAKVLPELWRSPRILARIQRLNVSGALARAPKYSGALQRLR